ncbi:MAG: primase-helicase family protein [Luteolibacter sp.]
MLYSIPNLTSTKADPFDPEKPTPQAPTGLDKEKHTMWATDQATNAAFVSGFVGLNPHIRVNRTTNPAYEMVALVADYDMPMDEAKIREAIQRMAKPGFIPAYAHQSYSGKGRVIWLFDKPFRLVPGLTESFLKLLKNEVGADNLLPGLDPKITRPEQYYHWHEPIFRISKNTISEDSLNFLLGRAFDTSKKYRGESSEPIALEAVLSKIHEVFPGRWTGNFERGSRGICFWDPESVNPTAAIVTETGMIAFSQPKPFYSWGDIFGPEFVRKFEQDKYGASLSAYHFDGKYYWYRDLDHGDWDCSGDSHTRHDIMKNFGLSGCPNTRGALSEADDALTQIRQLKKIDKAIPILYSPHEVSRIKGERVLNISQVRVIPPHDQPCPWGVGFPWIQNFLDNLLEPAESLQHLLAWLHRFYKSACDGYLDQGQAIFLAGGVGRGKTLLSSVIIGELMGGVADASDFLLGSSAWNKELIEKPVWAVDDALSITDHNKLQLWSAMIKKSVANTNHPYNAKFHDSTTVQWRGRIICSLNDDPESIRQIPHTDGSILDKIMLFKTSEHSPVFPSNSVLEATIRAELPYFARYLYDYVVPEELKTSSRYGVKSYHHPILLEDSRSMSRSAVFVELIDLFAVEFRRAKPEIDVWRGTTTALLQELQRTESLRELTKPYVNAPEMVGRKLAAAAALSPMVRRGKLLDGRTQWEIDLAPVVTNGSGHDQPTKPVSG